MKYEGMKGMSKNLLLEHTQYALCEISGFHASEHEDDIILIFS
jgi:hypothetical protein